MNKLERRFFLTKDEIKGTPFTKTADIAGKKISKIWIPCVPSHGNFNHINNGPYFKYAFEGLYNSSDEKLGVSASNSNKKCLWFRDSYESSSYNAYNFEATGGAIDRNGPAIKFGFYSSCYPFVLYLNMPAAYGSHNSTENGIFNSFYDAIGISEFPYICIDFSDFCVGSSSVKLYPAAYVLILDAESMQSSANKDTTYLTEPYATDYPFYYEEYTG